MKNAKLFHTVNKLKADLASMSSKERMDHIWYHFKWHIVAAIVGIILLISLIFNIAMGSRPTVLGGGIVNATLSDEGLQYLNEDYLHAMGYSASSAQVSLYDYGLSGMTTENLQLDANLTMSFMTMVGAKKMDYFIMDETAMNYYLDQGLYLDLQKVFSSEELQALSPYLIYSTRDTNNSSSYPIGICIDTLAFTSECIEADGSVFLMFAKNASHTDRLQDFYHFLCAWHSN